MPVGFFKGKPTWKENPQGPHRTKLVGIKYSILPWGGNASGSHQEELEDVARESDRLPHFKPDVSTTQKHILSQK